jgi:uncharacterized protein YkwD
MRARRGTRHRAAPRLSGRAALLLCGALAAAYLSAATAFLATHFPSAPTHAGMVAAARDVARAAASSCAQTAGTCSGPAPRQPAPHLAKHVPKPRTTATPARRRTPDPVSTPAASASQGPSAAVQQVLALVNSARAQAGLPAYTLTEGLDTSAARHNALMAGGCGLSHQCPGEPALGARETAAGVQWTAAGENVGEGGPVADTPAAIAQMAVSLTQSMLDEKPPDDGHRQNILSATFHHVGIAILRDGSGTVWMTQDFSD